MSFNSSLTFKKVNETESDLHSPAFTLNSGSSEVHNVMLRTSKADTSPKFEVFISQTRHKTNTNFQEEKPATLLMHKQDTLP